MTKITANDIKAAMLKRFGAPEWAILWEVANATGMNAGRRADAVMMSLWPSRGLELHGVEIKVSRSDWKREAADPTKAESVAKYCDRWWVHTAPGVVDDLSDVPPLWGLREWNGRCWNTVKEAGLSESEPMDRAFLAALLRRAGEGSQSMIDAVAEKAIAVERAKIDERIKREVDGRTRRYERLAKSVQEFEASFGARISDDFGAGLNLRYDAAQIGATAAAIVNAGLTSEYDGVKPILRALKKAVGALEEVERTVGDLAKGEAA